MIFHNLRGYDSHFIMQKIGEIVKKHTYVNKKGEETQMNINAIPNNMEKYICVIDQACSVKMAGYWPSSFFAFLWTETKLRSIKTQKKNEANIQPS